MASNHSQAGQQVERISISDKPHERYQCHEPYTGKKLKRGIPILLRAKGGKVVRKEITYYTVKCPECHTPAKYNNDSEPICPDCGIICAGNETLLEEQIVRDAKAAGRLDGNKKHN